MTLVSPSFARMASVTASTKRSPAVSGGKVGAQAENLTGLKIFPVMPMPLSAQKGIVEKYKIRSPRQIYVTYTAGTPDIKEADVLVVGSSEYKIVGAEPWPTDSSFLELILESVVGA